MAEQTSTVLCKTSSNPCPGGTYGKGTTIEASLKSGTKSVLDPPFGTIECSESSIKGEVTNPGGEGALVSGSVSSWSFGKCGSDIVSVLKSGTFTIGSAKEGDGTLKLEGFEITAEHVGTHCIYSGTATFSLKGGEMASLSNPSALQRTGGRSGPFCGSSATWTAEYTVTAPEPLWVEEPSISTVLCKAATNPCTGGTYGKGTTIEASLKSGTKSVLDPPFGTIECSESSIKGEVTNPGGEGSIVSGTTSSLTFKSCNGTVSVLKAGAFSIKTPKEGNGTLTLEGLETTVEFVGIHCIYSGTSSFTLKGGEMAWIQSPATLSRTGGRSEGFCGASATWTAEYTITAPEPLFVEGP
ncbi:MAG TPA: hypothetical protein VFX44_04075 [Solirubrobacterales bacterium]|nr:hypothetical protein [Solirubrobacterales bacterium]